MHAIAAFRLNFRKVGIGPGILCVGPEGDIVLARWRLLRANFGPSVPVLTFV